MTPLKDLPTTIQHSSPTATTPHPIFNPTVNLDFHSEDEDDSDYDPFAGL